MKHIFVLFHLWVTESIAFPNVIFALIHKIRLTSYKILCMANQGQTKHIFHLYNSTNHTRKIHPHYYTHPIFLWARCFPICQTIPCLLVYKQNIDNYNHFMHLQLFMKQKRTIQPRNYPLFLTWIFAFNLHKQVSGTCALYHQSHDDHKNCNCQLHFCTTFRLEVQILYDVIN